MVRHFELLSKAVVVRPDVQCPAVCALRGVTGYISAADNIGWDLTKGHLFPVVLANGSRENIPLSVVQMAASRVAGAFEGGRPYESFHHALTPAGLGAR